MVSQAERKDQQNQNAEKKTKGSMGRWNLCDLAPTQLTDNARQI